MERIFYPADVKDPITNLPIYIFDTSFLPSTELIDYNEFVPTLTSFLPTHPYVLIMFSCGLNKINWIWGIKFLKAFLDDSINLRNLWKVITVHDSWFIKSFVQMLSNFQSTKNTFAQLILELFDLGGKEERKNETIHCSTISELSGYVDITKLKISLNVYKHNNLLEQEILLSMRITPLINPYTKLDTQSIFYHHFYQIFRIIDFYGDKVELIFHKPGNKLNTDIFYKCINRNQLIWVNDWDLYAISTAFKRILMELPHKLIPIEMIPLPVTDDLQYTLNTFENIILDHEENLMGFSRILLQLCNLCKKITQQNVTRHTPVTLSKCLSHCLSHELISSNKDSILIINRFLKNVLDNWELIKGKFTVFDTVEQFLQGRVEETYEYDNSPKTPRRLYSSNSNTSGSPIEPKDGVFVEVTYENPGLTLDDSTNMFTFNQTKENVETKDFKLPTETSYSAKDSFSTPTETAFSIRDSFTTPAESLSTTKDSFKEPTESSLSNLESFKAPTETSFSIPSDLFRENSSDSKLKLKKPREPKKLTDVSNLTSPARHNRLIEKKKLLLSIKTSHVRSKSLPAPIALTTVPVKKPVIRGRKVGELAKLFEERTEGIVLLGGMSVS